MYCSVVQCSDINYCALYQTALSGVHSTTGSLPCWCPYKKSLLLTVWPWPCNVGLTVMWEHFSVITTDLLDTQLFTLLALH